jgi:hypothetical protein
MKRLAIAAMLSITTGLLTCGCMWGHVRDANTGLDVPGATVSWVDAQGDSGSTTTGVFWAPGLYVFCGYDLIPHNNPITFTVTAPGYTPLVVQTHVTYDENPNASLDPHDCSRFQEILDFPLVPLPPTSGMPPHTPVPTPTATPTVAHVPRPSPTSTPTRKPGFMVR